jgi:hypothetical protein
MASSTLADLQSATETAVIEPMHYGNFDGQPHKRKPHKQKPVKQELYMQQPVGGDRRSSVVSVYY